MCNTIINILKIPPIGMARFKKEKKSNRVKVTKTLEIKNKSNCLITNEKEESENKFNFQKFLLT